MLLQFTSPTHNSPSDGAIFPHFGEHDKVQFFISFDLNFYFVKVHIIILSLTCRIASNVITADGGLVVNVL